MTSEIITTAAGAGISLLAAYAPGFSTWFSRLSRVQKRLLLLIALFVVSLFVFMLSCARLESWGIECTVSGAWYLFKLFAASAIANQVTYGFIKPANRP